MFVDPLGGCNPGPEERHNQRRRQDHAQWQPQHKRPADLHRAT